MVHGGTLNTADLGAGAASIVNHTSTSHAVILGGTAQQKAIITGPTLPAAADVQSGAAQFGYAGDLQTAGYPTTAATNAAHQAADLAFLNANKDEMVNANASIQAQYGCDAGTGGGVSVDPGVGNVEKDVAYTINSVAKVGTFKVPAIGVVKANETYGANGTEFTGTYGNPTSPASGAVEVDIADAITAALDTAAFSQAFTPVRSYAEWEDALEDLNTLHVDVVPVQTGPATELDDRADVEYDCEIDIGVRYRFGTADQVSATGRVDTAKVDELILLVQEIAEFFMVDRLADANTAVWQDTEIKLGWSRKHLRQLRQFFGFVRLTFKATRVLT
jgi:hypothetical protein